jgi:hypothetical protein
MADHADPTGPEKDEDPGAALDGEPSSNGKSIADQAEEEAPLEQQEPPMIGDRQLSLAGFGVPRRVGAVSHVSLMSGRKEIDGVLNPEQDHLMLVKARVKGGSHDYERADETPAIKAATATQNLRPLSIRRIPPEIEAVVQQLMTVEEGDLTAVAERLGSVLEEYLPEGVAALA